MLKRFGGCLALLGLLILLMLWHHAIATIPTPLEFELDIFDTHRQIEAMLTALCAPFLATIPLRLRGWRLASKVCLA